MSFKAKAILVTGGSGALGSLVAQELREEGAQVTTLDRVPSSGGKPGLIYDLSSPVGLEAAAAAIADTPWDILINLAGLQHFGPIERQTPEHLVASYMVNLIAPVRVAQAVLPGMKARAGGQIVNVGSVFGSINFAHFATYSSAKAGLRGFSQALRRELAGSGVSVVYIAPRAVRTPLHTEEVSRFIALTGMTMDEPDGVAARIVEAVRQNRPEAYLGFPENLFVRLNALAPGILDRALRAQDRKAAALFAR